MGASKQIAILFAILMTVEHTLSVTTLFILNINGFKMIQSVLDVLAISPRIKHINLTIVILSLILFGHFICVIIAVSISSHRIDQSFDTFLTLRAVTYGLIFVIFWTVPYMTWIISTYFVDILGSLGSTNQHLFQ